jgi:hypothetical protein
MSDISAVREVIIDDLPNGYSKEQLQKMVVNSSLTSVNVVAVKGYANDWSAYIGFPSIFNIKDTSNNSYAYYCLEVHDPDGVARNGDKISEREARELFPEFEDLYYRS